MDAVAEEIARRHLDQVIAEGYRPHRVVLSAKRGCTSCGTVNEGKPFKDWTKFMFSIVGQRLESRVYVYSFVLLCRDTCLQSLQVHESLAARLVEVFKNAQKN